MRALNEKTQTVTVKVKVKNVRDMYRNGNNQSKMLHTCVEMLEMTEKSQKMYRNRLKMLQK